MSNLTIIKETNSWRFSKTNSFTLMHTGRLEDFEPVAGENYSVPTTTVHAAGGTLSVTFDGLTISHNYEGL